MIMEERAEFRKRQAEEERKHLEQKLEQVKKYNDWMMEKKRQDFLSRESKVERKRREFEEFQENERRKK